MKVKISEIKSLCEILLKKVQESGYEEIEIDTDYYWIVDSKDREDFSIAEPGVNVGSLVDDIESLKKVLEGINPPTLVDLDRLANLIVAVGEKIYHSYEDQG